MRTQYELALTTWKREEYIEGKTGVNDNAQVH